MPRGRPNRSSAYDRSKFDIDQALSLNDDEIKSGVRKMADSHWFDDLAIAERGAKFNAEMPHLRVIDLDDQEIPARRIAEMGRLVRLHIRAPRKQKVNPRRERDTMLQLSKQASENSFVAWDMDHPEDRMYLILDPKVQDVIRQRFWDENPVQEMVLSHLASLVGGRHSKKSDYAKVQVKPVGVLTAVVYFTHKNKDGPSYYIHKMAELSHHYPILCCDDIGRLWIAGGNYTVPTPGITD